MPHIPTYVIHPTTGHEDREAHLVEHLPSVGLTDYEFIKEGDADALSNDIINDFFGPGLTLGGMSCNYKHYLSYKYMLERDQDYCLILENDVFVDKDILSQIGRMLAEVKSKRNWLINIEEASELVPIWYRKPGKLVYRAGKNKMAAGYIVDKYFAQTMVTYLEANLIDKNFDSLISQVAEELAISLYWSHPPLVRQGSKDGTFASEISDEQQGFWVKIKSNTRNFYKMHVLSNIQPKRLRLFRPYKDDD
ncbi:glycosyltransferase family 25 protein [Vibrio agarivorans]|uniref:glycosyltransferase family 25 protein n=1 Tax=Vibrio agarivorans TaxID=153622 RepID=UPI0025B5E8F4|nr:glycosyltransferase family 25 protein [Vibrio agarivorans]MDN3662173.1 glycosyltransferase family 25 protein [Vibrio agarivorans]